GCLPFVSDTPTPTASTPRRASSDDSFASLILRAASMSAADGPDNPPASRNPPHDEPTTENVWPPAVNALTTALAGFPIVLVLLPANRRPTGFGVPSSETMSEPESPPAENVPGVIAT